MQRFSSPSSLLCENAALFYDTPTRYSLALKEFAADESREPAILQGPAFKMGKFFREHMFGGALSGYSYLDKGASSIAYHKGNTVVKLMLFTQGMFGTVSQEHNFVDMIKEHIAANKKVHPAETVDTEVIYPFVTRSGGRPVIALRQPYIDGTILAKPEDARGDDARALGDFASRTITRMLPEGFVTDVIGTSNFVVQHDGALKLVDTVAISRQLYAPVTFGNAVSVLHSMVERANN